MMDANRTTALDSLVQLAVSTSASTQPDTPSWPALAVDDFVGRARNLQQRIDEAVALEAANDAQRAKGQTAFCELREQYDNSAKQRRAELEARVQRAMAESGEDLHKELAQARRGGI